MQECKVLVVGAEAERLGKAMGDFEQAYLVLEDADAAADLLWEKGDDVRVVALERKFSQQPEVKELVALCERDWPGLEIVWV